MDADCQRACFSCASLPLARFRAICDNASPSLKNHSEVYNKLVGELPPSSRVEVK